MTVRTNGSELKAFFADKTFWPDDQPGGNNIWHDELTLIINDDEDLNPVVENLLDSDHVKITYGDVYYSNTSLRVSVETYFKRWKKTTTHTSVLVSVPNEHLEAVKAAIIGAGGTLA
jgi:hypothetical protein